jgi:hypothetical protein
MMLNSVIALFFERHYPATYSANASLLWEEMDAGKLKEENKLV